MLTILSLCDGTGAWSRPYEEAGYDVISVDVRNGDDVRLFRVDDLPPVRGVLAAPPCTEFAGSGARWWLIKGEEPLREALSIVDACVRIITVVSPVWWCLENPVGRLRSFIGEPVATFQPYEYGDPYSKRTCLWGRFTMPQRCPVEPIEGSKMHRLPPSEDRAKLRSVTPTGFAEAFCRANP